MVIQCSPQLSIMNTDAWLLSSFSNYCYNLIFCFKLVLYLFIDSFNVAPFVCGGFVFGPCFLMQYLESLLAMWSSHWGRESLLHTVNWFWLYCGYKCYVSSSRRHRFICNCAFSWSYSLTLLVRISIWKPQKKHSRDLTHLSRMEFLTVINWICPFLI